MDIRICQCAGEDDNGDNDYYNGYSNKEKVKEQKRKKLKGGTYEKTIVFEKNNNIVSPFMSITRIKVE